MLGNMIMLIMEWIGTISFAVSGALVAIGCSLDLFGVVIVGCMTAFGGGVIRDILIGNIPPKVFMNPPLIIVAIVTSVLVFCIAYVHRNKFNKIRTKTENINNFFDALGLAAFSITGIEVVCLSAYESNVFLTITLGVLTGVGGGIIRDILVNEKPYVLTKHIYAVVSVAGCVIYYVISVCLGHKVVATVFVVLFTVVMRMLAAKFRWKLPKVKLDENNEQ